MDKKWDEITRDSRSHFKICSKIQQPNSKRQQLTRPPGIKISICWTAADPFYFLVCNIIISSSLQWDDHSQNGGKKNVDLVIIYIYIYIDWEYIDICSIDILGMEQPPFQATVGVDRVDLFHLGILHSQLHWCHWGHLPAPGSPEFGLLRNHRSQGQSLVDRHEPPHEIPLVCVCPMKIHGLMIQFKSMITVIG